jgi:RND family efflux transporter MFP subunit
MIGFIRRQPSWRLIAALMVVAAAGVFLFRGGGGSTAKIPTFAARRGPLEITVLEGGSLQALESQEIKCEVRVGYQGTKILKIVEEGYLVTDDDVKTNKVLVELDGSDLQKQIVQQEIQYQSAVANLTDSQQGFEIQLNQNQSDVKAAEQKARFARMDFDKFLGDSVTTDLIARLGLDRLLALAGTNNVEETVHAEEVAVEKKRPQPAPVGAKPVLVPTAVTNASTAQPPVIPVVARVASHSNTVAGGSDEAVEPVADEPPGPVALDFSKYANIDALGDGEAKQKLRKFEDDLQVAQKELGQSKGTIEGTRRLFDKGFVTRTDLQRDEIAFENSRLKVQTAETARDLFLKYEFPKSAEEWLSKYAEAVREFDKARRVAISRLAQARAKLKSAQGQHEVQLRQKKDLNEQLEKCTLRAQKSGLVVYGGNRDDMMYYGGEERIREGASVRERQAIITIPDTTRMSVNVKIHESYIKKVKKGLKARITVDAFPEEVLTGEVTKVGVLPDSQNRWMNPDMKVYLTTVAVDGTHDWVKPGMSAKVEILVKNLGDVLYIPVQAVSPSNGKQVCYVAQGFKPERREVEVGEFNDEFIEVKSGLKEGERVLLRQPGSSEAENVTKEKSPPENEPAKPSAPAAPSPKAGKA